MELDAPRTWILVPEESSESVAAEGLKLGLLFLIQRISSVCSSDKRLALANSDRANRYVIPEQVLWAPVPRLAVFREKGEMVEDKEEFRSARVGPPKKSSSGII